MCCLNKQLGSGNLLHSRVPLGANKLLLKGCMKRDHRGLQKIYVILYSFCILGENFARDFEIKQCPFPWSFS